MAVRSLDKSIDLVDRIRVRAHEGKAWTPSDLMDEAADEIDRLRDVSAAAQDLQDAVSDEFGELAVVGWGREIIVAYLELQKLTDEYGLLPGVKSHDTSTVDNRKGTA